MKKQLKKLTASASALTMLAASMTAGGVIASAMEAPENPTTSDYTFTIPSTPTVTQAGYNATDGVTAKGTLAKNYKLVITADSDGEFALVSGDNKIGYNLVDTDNADTEFDSTAVAPSWEFTELNTDGVTQPLGIVVEDFTDKPRGQYTDTVTFTAKLEDVPVPLQSISLNKSSMVLFTNNGNKTEQLTVNFNPEDTTDDKTVTWTSSNPAVATVDENGKVTAVATGDAVITAKVGDKTASCNVAVNKVTITNSEATKKAIDTNPLPEFIKDGIVKVSFDSKGDLCGNNLNSDGWCFYGYGATVTVTSTNEDFSIAKVKFYTKNGSAEVTQAPFTVYSYWYNMYTGPDRTGTCFNDWGVNRIEVYLEPVGSGAPEEPAPEAPDPTLD